MNIYFYLPRKLFRFQSIVHRATPRKSNRVDIFSSYCIWWPGDAFLLYSFHSFSVRTVAFAELNIFFIFHIAFHSYCMNDERYTWWIEPGEASNDRVCSHVLNSNETLKISPTWAEASSAYRSRKNNTVAFLPNWKEFKSSCRMPK